MMNVKLIDMVVLVLCCYCDCMSDFVVLEFCIEVL